MKRNLKSIICFALVLVLALSCLSGCGNDNRSVEEKYGISFTGKTAVYNGSAQLIEIAVDSSLLGDKSYTVEYSTGETVLSKPEFKDAGKYDVVAKVTVDGDETVYELKATLEITKKPISIEIGNLFLEEGRGNSTIGDVDDILDSVTLAGSDKASALGKASFKVTNGTKTVSDVSTLDPVTDINKPYKVDIVFDGTSNNYDITTSNGKLYVLSSADYNEAVSLKTNIAKVPTADTIDTYDYYKMKDFLNIADSVVSDYPSTSDIQRLMCGSVDINAVATLKKTAYNRIFDEFDFEIDSDYAELEVLGVTHYNNDGRFEIVGKDHDDYISGLANDKTGSNESAEIGDDVALKIVLKDGSDEYLFEGAYFNDKFISADLFAFDGDRTYYLGDTRDTSATVTGSHWSSVSAYFGALEDANMVPVTYKVVTDSSTKVTTVTESGTRINFGAQDKETTLTGGTTQTSEPLELSASLVGALNGKAEVVVKPVITTKHDIVVKNTINNKEVSVVNNASNDKDTVLAGLETIRLTTGSSNLFTSYDVGSLTDPTGEALMGKEVELYITTADGYEIDEIEIGSKVISGTDLKGDSYEFVLTDDHLNSSDELEIVVTTTKVHSVVVKINDKTIYNSNKDGTYVADGGTLKVTGISSDSRPTIKDGEELGVSIDLEDYYTIQEVTIKGYYGTSGEDTSGTDLINKDTLLKELVGSGREEIAIGTTKTKLVPGEETPITINIKYTEQYNIEAIATVVDAWGDDSGTDYKMDWDNGDFVSNYGEITVMNGSEDYSRFTNNAKYYVEVVPERGYILSGLEINGMLWSFADADTDLEKVERQMSLIGKDIRTNATSVEYNYGTLLSSDASNYSTNTLFTFKSSKEAGETITIQAYFVPYYTVGGSKTTGDVRIEIPYAYEIDDSGNATANSSIISDAEDTGVIKTSSGKYYVIGNDAEVGFVIKNNDNVTSKTDDGTTTYYWESIKEIKYTIGNAPTATEKSIDIYETEYVYTTIAKALGSGSSKINPGEGINFDFENPVWEEEDSTTEPTE